MSTETSELSGPDLGLGVPLSSLPEGAMLQGHAGGEAVLLVRRGGELFALGAFCTHYGAPLADGLLVDGTIRCPWHHACFNLRTGHVLRAPARDPLPRWRVEEALGIVYVREKLEEAAAPVSPEAGMPESVVIVGGGAAGNAAAETLRREGYAGRITMLSADQDLPCDRPNLSKSYLAGTAPEDWIPLRTADFYREHEIDVHLDARVAMIDLAGGQVVLADGGRHSYDALLLATGAQPVRLDIPGADLGHVHYLRTVADSRKLVAAALTAKRAVVIGARFIGLEVAASLRARDVDVHVVGLEAIPMEAVLGPEAGRPPLWDFSSGTYNSRKNVVVIGTDGVYTTGSSNFVLHELGHALDYNMRQKNTLASELSDFQQAYADANSAHVFDHTNEYYYEHASNPTGYHSETFAESFAATYAPNSSFLPPSVTPVPNGYYGHGSILTGRPTLQGYWSGKFH